MTFKDLETIDRRDRVVSRLKWLLSQNTHHTQTTLAKEIGVTQSQVALLLNGQRKLEYVQVTRILDALDVSHADFLVMLDEPTPLD